MFCVTNLPSGQVMQDEEGDAVRCARFSAHSSLSLQNCTESQRHIPCKKREHEYTN